MNPTSVLSPEIVDLGLAIGLLRPSGGNVEFDSDWFSAPGPKVSRALAEEGRREALVRFVDAVNGEGGVRDDGGVKLLKLFDAGELGLPGAPDLVVNITIDGRAATFVEVGLSVDHATSAPVETRTELRVPLYRTGKRVDGSIAAVPEHFALAAGSPLRLASTISTGSGAPDASDFGLAGVTIALSCPVAGGDAPSVELGLDGLRLPGSTSAVDLQIGGPDSSIEDALLSLVVGVVRASAPSLGGAGAAALAALDLIGLGPNPVIPPLDLDTLAGQGVTALRGWFTAAMDDASVRSAWLGALSDVVGGGIDGGELVIAVSGDVELRISVTAALGPGGHLRVTPRIGLALADVLGSGSGAVRLSAEATVDVVTIDVADGQLTPVPNAELRVGMAGDGVRLLDAGPVEIGSAQIGVGCSNGEVVPILRLLDVEVGPSTHDVVDLTNADAVVAAAGEIAGDLLAAALDALGDAAPHLKTLLGIEPPAGVAALDAAQLLANPLAAVGAWWNDLVTDAANAAHVPAVLAHLRDLMANDASVALPVTGTGTSADPWSIPIAGRVSLDAWVDGSTFVVAPTLGFRVDDLAGGCTVVTTALRAELAAIDFANGTVSLLRAAELVARLRGRGLPHARLALGPVAIQADSLGVAARWSAAGGFGVAFEAPGLGADIGAALDVEPGAPSVLVPLAIPIGDDWQSLVLADVENLVGVLAASNPAGWLHDLVDLFGWRFGGPQSPDRLSLAALLADPAAELSRWALALAADADLLARLTTALARVFTGSTAGLAGALTGRGTPTDPWVLPLGSGVGAPAISLALGPAGPVLVPSQTSDALRSWRPGMPGLSGRGLGQAVLDEGLAGDDTAALARGRQPVGVGLEAIGARVAGTDVMVAPPPNPPDGVEVIAHPSMVWSRWNELPVARVLGAAPPANAAVVRVAIGTAGTHPWDGAPAGRLIDLSASGLLPESFTVNAPDEGEWFVVLATRADASLGVADPSGVLGQAARLRRVVAALGAARPVVLVATGGAGHAARLAADAEPAVTHLVTLGTPWSPVAFETARTGVSADALRLLVALLPAVDPAEPDDADLANGRAVVTGLRDARAQVDIEAPRPDIAVRAGLTVRAWFGALERVIAERALTAVVAAGLAARARAREASASAAASDALLALQLPVPTIEPPGGHGITVEGHVSVGLTSSGFAAGTVQAAPRVDVGVIVADTDAWLVGGPGTTPGAGAAPLEVRYIEARLSFGMNGGPSTAELILHEASALGAYRDRIVVRPDPTVTGTSEDLPFLPEARALVAAVVTRLRAAAPGSPAALLAALLDGIGLSGATGLVPDALSHLLHDPAAFIAPVLSAAIPRLALAQAVAHFVPGAAGAGDVVTVTHPIGTIELDLASRRISVVASGAEGVLPWELEVHGIGGAGTTGSVTIGDPEFNAGALRLDVTPFAVALAGADATGDPTSVALWPNPDVDGLARFAAAALPAEAVRLVLEGVRGIDATVAVGIEALAAALGVLGPPDALGRRNVLAPVALLRDSGGWFRTVLEGTPSEQVERVVDVFEAVKPFVGLAGTPRGTWPVVDGVTLEVTSGATGPTMSVAIDPTAWLGGPGRPPFAAGVDLGLTLTPTGAPTAAVALFVGLPEAVPSPDHRRAVHVNAGASGLQAFLRPTTGADIALYPNPAGLGALLAAGVEQLLPMALTALAQLTGSTPRDRIGEVVSAVGRGLDVVVEPDNAAIRATFDGDKLHTLADDPAGHLATRATALVTQAAGALDPLLDLLPGSLQAQVSSGNLVVTVHGVVLTIVPSPLSISAQGSLSGLDVVDTATGGFSADATGLTAWSFGVGPAELDLDGPKLRPLIRGSRTGPAGWEIQLGLALDDLTPTTDGHKELFARWREADGLAPVARTRTGGSDQDETDPGRVAVFAADAVLELLGNWVIQLDDVETLLDTSVNGSPVRELLAGSVLAAPDGLAMIPAPVSRLPGSLFVLARKVADALPPIPLGPFELALHHDGDVVGLRLDIVDAAQGLELNPGSDVVLALVTDATWIDPPSGNPPEPGIVVDVLSITAADPPVVEVHPGIAVNGLGVRISGGSGPLLDAGLRIEALAVHLFGALSPAGGGVAVSGGIQVELQGLAVPLGGGGGDNAVAQGVMQDAGGSGAPPTPKFSPGLAVQSHHGGNGVAVSLRAGSGDGPWYLPIQRAFGPVYIEQVGLGVGYRTSPPPKRLDWIAVSLDGSVSLFGLTASVDKLRLTYQVNQPFFEITSWEVDLDGFALASEVGGLTLVGALRRAPLSPQGVEYLGMLKIGFSGYGVDLFGGYAHATGLQGGFASFFAFGALHAPLGGPPAFFITGIGLGFGINRALAPPTMDTITTNPFLVAMKALGPPPDPMGQLEQMRTQIAPAQGQYWVAAGISFTSFVLVTGEVVVTVEFGDGLDVVVLGLARCELPGPGLTLVSIELGLIARFSTKEGTLLVQAQLTANSWLLTRSVRLTGGFAFQTWWKGPNAGQFVVTMGGYHPKFHHDGYPAVPRLGLSWRVADNISITGASYFALCSEALMAGTSMEVSARFGPAYASLSYGCDGIVFFDPFWFRVSAWAEVRAGIRIWVLFGTIDIEISLGVFVEITGPPIHVEGRFEICEFEIPFEFGDEGNPADRALTAGQFRDKYLRATADAQVIQAAILRGAVTSGRKADGSQQKVPDGSATNPFLVIPEFELVIITTAPAIDMALTHDSDPAKTMHVNAPDIGVAPMYSHTLTSELSAELDKLDAPMAIEIDRVNVAARPTAAFPKGVWGEAPNPDAPRVPAGEVVDACDGFTMSTSLGEFTGAPEIDYHQVELPFGGRKPLPFVTNTVAINMRVTASMQLKAIADDMRPDDDDLDARFNVAARLLDAGGYGTVGVAALRGERAAVPAFGSLADDMANAPAVVSSPVTGVVVDRTPPMRPYVAPIVKAVIGAPLSQATRGGLHTTVADATGALRREPPTLAGMRRAVSRIGPASLVTQPIGIQFADVITAPRSGRRRGRGARGAPTILARGQVPVSRIATSPVAAVTNARPDRAGAERLSALTTALPGGAVVHEGELAVIAVASRSPDGRGESLSVTGGLTRVIALAAGGNVLFDNMTNGLIEGIGSGRGRVSRALVELPPKTERLVVVAVGDRAGVGGSLDGWYAGQSLPLVGWGMALGAGVLVRFANHKARPNRERHDGGWGNTRELARAATVTTRFDAAVKAIAIAVDDASAAGAGNPAKDLDMRLVGARRRLASTGQPLPPRVLVQGVRTILVYDVVPEPDTTALDPNVLVVVDGTRDGQLAGVAGTTGTASQLIAALTASGFDAAIRVPLPGGVGTRTIKWRSAAEVDIRKAQRATAQRARAARSGKTTARPAKATARPAKKTARPVKATARPAKKTARPAKATAAKATRPRRT